MVTFEGIFLWNYHPYREAEGLVRERVRHWTILRAVPESKSNPFQTNTSYNFVECFPVPYMSTFLLAAKVLSALIIIAG